MWHMLRIVLLVATILSIIGVTAGCGSDDEALPEAQPLLAGAVDKFEEAGSFQMKIDVDGYPVSFGTGSSGFSEGIALEFQLAEGVYVAPDLLQANVWLELGDTGFTAELIAAGTDQYLLSDLLTNGQWTKQVISAGFSAMALMSQETGMPHALRNVAELKMVGKEDLDGVDVYHLRGNVEASEVNAITFGLIATQTGQLKVDIYILKNDRTIERLVIHEPLPDGVEGEKPTTWVISFFDFNKPFSIPIPQVTGAALDFRVMTGETGQI